MRSGCCAGHFLVIGKSSGNFLSVIAGFLGGLRKKGPHCAAPRDYSGNRGAPVAAFPRRAGYCRLAACMKAAFEARKVRCLGAIAAQLAKPQSDRRGGEQFHRGSRGVADCRNTA